MPPAPGVFLDRDGVLNARRFPFVRKPEQVRMLPGVAESVARLTRAGYRVAIATNQDLVGHGAIRREDHEAIMRRVVEAAQARGGRIDAAYACIHPRTESCEERKPRPGMLTRGARELGLDLAASWMVGDQAKDVRAGRAAGCRTLLVDPRLRTWLQGARRHADAVARDLPAAVEIILRRGPGAPTS